MWGEEGASSLPFRVIYLDSTRFTVVDAHLYDAIVARTGGRLYVHKSRKCLYVRSWLAGHAREYLHHIVQDLMKRRRPSEHHVVRHLSGNTFDNRGCNLRWGTKGKNVRDVPYVEQP